MNMTEQQVIEQALTCARLAGENFQLRDMVLNLQAQLDAMKVELPEEASEE